MTAQQPARASPDVLAYKGSARSRLKRSPGWFPRRRSLPQAHWWQIHSTNPLERLNKEIKRRTNVVGVRSFPRPVAARPLLQNEAAIRRLVGALMLEHNDEWAVTRRYMTLETVATICEDATMDPAEIAAL